MVLVTPQSRCQAGSAGFAVKELESKAVSGSGSLCRLQKFHCHRQGELPTNGITAAPLDVQLAGGRPSSPSAIESGHDMIIIRW